MLLGKPWSGRVFNGGWVAGGAGERAVIEPATGNELGRIGMAAPGDVAGAVSAGVYGRYRFAPRR